MAQFASNLKKKPHRKEATHKGNEVSLVPRVSGARERETPVGAEHVSPRISSSNHLFLSRSKDPGNEVAIFVAFPSH